MTLNTKLNAKLNALVMLAAFSIGILPGTFFTATVAASADEPLKAANSDAQAKPNKQLAAIELPVGATTDGAVKPPLPAAATDAEAAQPKVMLKPNQPLVLGTSQEDLQPTDDANVAREQKDKYPDSPEAHFIYAVALTRTSRVEEALQEVRTARRLAMPLGGYTYFDKMIKSYEEVLESAPDDSRIRYGLAWAYYMKAYLLAQDSKKAQTIIAPAAAAVTAKPTDSQADGGSGFTAKAEKKQVDNATALGILSALNPDLAKKASSEPGKTSATSMPHVPSALEKAAPFAVPEVKQYYQLAIKNLDQVIAKKPDDVWAAAYKWHLYAEYSGDLDESMKQWKALLKRFPFNPALYLFYGEGWLKKGNLKECIVNVSHAIMLRGLGN
jgi:tetratricopeptide (TPR) repeat protein